VFTRLGDLRDVDSLLGRHEAQDGEHHEARKETGAAVDQSQDEGVSEETARDGSMRSIHCGEDYSTYYDHTHPISCT